jgi:hypothetical protein
MVEMRLVSNMIVNEAVLLREALARFIGISKA